METSDSGWTRQAIAKAPCRRAPRRIHRRSCATRTSRTQAAALRAHRARPECQGTGYFSQAVEHAGLKGQVTFHSRRHLFACRCLARGIPMSVVSDYLGHSSIELTVKLYGRFSDDAREKWKWIEVLDEPMEAVAKRRMLTVGEGSGTSR